MENGRRMRYPALAKESAEAIAVGAHVAWSRIDPGDNVRQ